MQGGRKGAVLIMRMRKVDDGHRSFEQVLSWFEEKGYKRPEARQLHLLASQALTAFFSGFFRTGGSLQKPPGHGLLFWG